MCSNTSITMSKTHTFTEGDVICTRPAPNNGFWKMLLYWIIRKDLDRGDFSVITKIISDTEIETEDY